MAAIYRENRFDEALEDYTPDHTKIIHVCMFLLCDFEVSGKLYGASLDTGPFWECAGHTN